MRRDKEWDQYHYHVTTRTVSQWYLFRSMMPQSRHSMSYRRRNRIRARNLIEVSIQTSLSFKFQDIRLLVGSDCSYTSQPAPRRLVRANTKRILNHLRLEDSRCLSSIPREYRVWRFGAWRGRRS